MFKQSESKPPFFVLQRYKDSLGITTHLSHDNIAECLREIAVKHFQTYAFHSLYFNLTGPDTSIPLNKNALINQLVETQGGSCFHHNAVFQAILENNGIASSFAACLVHNPMQPKRTFELATHITIIFNHQNTLYLFDPGWDGSSFSIYELPADIDSTTKQGNYQVRKTNNAHLPYTFEEIKADGSIAPRYDFSTKPTELKDFQDAITYLNSETYAFHTLFLFTRINSNQQIIRFVNHHVSIQNTHGETLNNYELNQDFPPLQHIRELFGSQEGLMQNLSVDDFKNPELGKLICPAPFLTLSSNF